MLHVNSIGKINNFKNMIQHKDYIVGRVISGFCREVDENCALLGYYAVSSGNFLPTCWDNL